jgi:hypothetical protein
MKKLNILICVLVLGAVVWFGFIKNKVEAPTNTEPTAKITYDNTSADYIVVDLPFPGAVTGKEFKVTGKARGFYFEASFPVEVLDKDGKQIFIAPAQAQGDWMVDAFVPFSIDVKVPESYIGPATLVLHKDNPSGEPAYDASISFPFTIEY